MEEVKIPKKLINVCKTCVQNTRIVVRIEGTLSSSFENKTVLKQGDSVSPILFSLTLQKVIQSIEMIPSGIRICKEQLNLLEYADDIVLIGKNEIEIRQLFCRNRKHCQKVRTTHNQGKTKYMIVERKNSSN
jgi:hypothetical protein